jgi:F-type H+-transporting ATPase subunit b
VNGISHRRLLWLLLLTTLLVLAAHPVLAQEIQGHENGAADDAMKWKVINTAIFAIGLGWFLWRFAPAFFNARSADIQKAIKDATGLKIEAEFRYSEIDKKMATLADEVKKMRDQEAIEMEREHQRLRDETNSAIEHIRRNVAAEVEAFRQEGVYQLRQHTAQLAMQVAERQLQERFQAGEPDDLMQDFIRLVERGNN